MIGFLQSGGGAPLYQLKIMLKGSKPSIWRRVLVRSDIRLDRLHHVIQRVMGWTDSHLHQFIVGGVFYGVPDSEAGFDLEVLDERRYTIADLASGAKSRFIYEYDFGDGWEHLVMVEKVSPPDPAFRRPVCLAGAWPVPRRIAAVFGVITLCSRRSRIPSIRNIGNGGNGSAASGTRRGLIWRK